MDSTPFLTAIVRHTLSGVAGALVAKGLLSLGNQAQFVDIATGIAMGAASMGWSWWQKHKQQKAVVTAAETGVIK